MSSLSSGAEPVLESLLVNYLRSSETLQAILVSTAQTIGTDDSIYTTAANQIHILSVVVHRSSTGEEGSIFIFKPKNVITQSQIPEFFLVSTVALTSRLDISMLQSKIRPGIVDLREMKHAPASQRQMIIKLSWDNQEQLFVVDATDLLRTFMSECRRLIKISNASSTVDYHWLKFYDSKLVRHKNAPSLFNCPDLRTLQLPVHSRLSPAYAGQPGDEYSDIILIRDNWIRQELADAREKFSKPRTIRVRIGTFNVNGKVPSQDLASWIRPQVTSISPTSDHPEPQTGQMSYESEPDLIVLGFQELDLSTEALIYSYTTTREELWLEAIFAALGEVRDQYTKLASKQLVGMLIIIIAKTDLAKQISDIRTCAIGTGLLGIMGNKGATAVRITVGSTVISFVNAHLAAFDEYTERRNADFHDLSNRLVFQSTSKDATVDGAEDGSSSRGVLERSDIANDESVFESHVLFWMGDLNYRIDLPDTDVRQLIASDPRGSDIKVMLKYDQLVKAMRNNISFEDFREGEIRHLPSYRFGAGLVVDRNGYDTKRRPAWTDRILYLVDPLVTVVQTGYDAHFGITMSDHRPVSAQFSVETWAIDESAYNEHASSLLMQLGDFEDTDKIPSLKISSAEINFGSVKYMQKVTRKLELRNVGKSACAFRFISPTEDQPLVPAWLSIYPQTGIILENETLELELTIVVDNKTAPSLNLGYDLLECMLIIHTERGKDDFVFISGQYHKTCFANELETLVRLPGPILNVDSRIDLSKGSTTNAPREILKLISWLMSNDSSTPGMFMKHGEPDLVEHIRDCLDTGGDFSFPVDKDEHALSLAFGDTLLLFLQSLPTPVIPPFIHQQCIQASSRDEAFEIVSQLPSSFLNVWISLTAYLHYFVQRSLGLELSDSVVDAEALARIFSPILLGDSLTMVSPLTPLQKRTFVLLFIQS